MFTNSRCFFELQEMTEYKKRCKGIQPMAAIVQGPPPVMDEDDDDDDGEDDEN